MNNKEYKENTEKVIKEFISCFAKDYEELYLSSFNEIQCLKDATNYMKDQQKIIDELKADAEKRKEEKNKTKDLRLEQIQFILNINKIKKENDFEYYAWPQKFNSTAGPNNAIGGCAMTNFTVEIYHSKITGLTIYFCDNYHWLDYEFKPFKYIKNWIELPKKE